MNPVALLSLIGDLYEQIKGLQAQLDAEKANVANLHSRLEAQAPPVP